MRSHTLLAEPAETQGLRHDRTTILLHWVSAVLVAVLWVMGQTVDDIPSGWPRTIYLSLHMLGGVLLGLVILLRLGWRVTRGGMAPPQETGPLLDIARLTHALLYGLLVLTVLLGLVNAWARGAVVFGLFRLPPIIPGDRPFMRLVAGWHALAANAVLIVAGLHTAAALFHHYVLRDATLRRMLPWQERRRRV
jgi:cytochrome b561